MTSRREPFIVTEPSRGARLWARLADVIVTTTDGRPTGRQFADLFEAHPGLALVLITAPLTATVSVAVRDGRAAQLPAELPLPASVPLLCGLATVLYFDWIVGAGRTADSVPECRGS
jgi:hypothetical protein